MVRSIRSPLPNQSTSFGKARHQSGEYFECAGHAARNDSLSPRWLQSLRCRTASPLPPRLRNPFLQRGSEVDIARGDLYRLAQPRLFS